MIKARLILRNDTTENWNSKNPTLLEGEAGYDNKAHLLKIGDGSTPWKDLRSIAGAPATTTVIGGVLSSLDDDKIQVDSNGIMSVNRISVEHLYVPEGEDFILNCGTAK